MARCPAPHASQYLAATAAHGHVVAPATDDARARRQRLVDVVVVALADWVRHRGQALGVGRAQREQVDDDEATVAPCDGTLHAALHGVVEHFVRRLARVQHQPRDDRQRGVPLAPQDVAVPLVDREDSARGHADVVPDLQQHPLIDREALAHGQVGRAAATGFNDCG